MKSIIVETFLHDHQTDLPQAKFKIGDCVIVHHHNEENLATHEKGSVVGYVLAVSDTGDGIEYAVSGWPMLLWEEELRK